MVSQIDCQELLERLSIRLGSAKGSLMQATNHGDADADIVDKDVESTKDTESIENLETTVQQ